MAKDVATSSRWSLSGKTALVTGGARGIGRAIVEELAQLGAIVHTFSRTEDELNQLLQEWTLKGYNVTGSVCDASSGEQRKQLMEKVSCIFNGKVNILVNNVGTLIVNPAAEFTPEDYSFLMSTNLYSYFYFSQLAYPLLKASGNGNIVFISSVAGMVQSLGRVGDVTGTEVGEPLPFRFYSEMTGSPRNPSISADSDRIDSESLRFGRSKEESAGSIRAKQQAKNKDRILTKFGRWKVALDLIFRQKLGLRERQWKVADGGLILGVYGW